MPQLVVEEIRRIPLWPIQGSAGYAFPGVRVTSLGDRPGGVRIIEPAAELGAKPVAAGTRLWAGLGCFGSGPGSPVA